SGRLRAGRAAPGQRSDAGRAGRAGRPRAVPSRGCSAGDPLRAAGLRRGGERAPLTVMKSSLDILVSSPKFEYTADQRQLIAFCQESVERLIRLVKDILDVSKIEA